MTPPPTADTEVPTAGASWILDVIAGLPPWAQLLAYLLPIVMLVSWGPWAWLFAAIGGALAAQHVGTDGVLVSVWAGGAVGYVLNCGWNPMADCRWCKGSPKRRDGQRNFHWCFWCGGNGRRTRLGAYVWPKHRARAD